MLINYCNEQEKKGPRVIIYDDKGFHAFPSERDERGGEPAAKHGGFRLSKADAQSLKVGVAYVQKRFDEQVAKTNRKPSIEAESESGKALK